MLDERGVGSLRGATAVVVAGIRLYREALAVAVSSMPGTTVVGVVAELGAALTVVARERPDFVVVDHRMVRAPGVISTFQRAHWPTLVIAFGVRDDPTEYVAFAELGAAAVVPEDAGQEEIRGVLAAARDGELLCSSRVAGRLFRRVGELVEPGVAIPAPRAPVPQPGAELTRREQEIAVLVAQGLMNKEIARSLGISLSTVKNHVHRVLAKRALTRRSQLVGRALMEVLDPRADSPR